MQPSTVLQPSSVRPITPCFIISAYSFISLFLIPFPTHFMFPIFVLFHVPCPDPRSEPQTLIPNSRSTFPILFYFASCPLVLFSFLCFFARTHARFPRPCYVPFNTYTSKTSCMFLSLKLHRLSPLNSCLSHPNLPNSLETPPIQIEDKRMSGGKASKLKPHPRRTLLSAVIIGSSRELLVTL